MTGLVAFMIVGGLAMTCLALMSLLNASIEDRKSRLAYVFFLAGAVICMFGMISAPGGFSFSNVPNAFLEVVWHILN